MKRFPILLLVLISDAGCSIGSPPSAIERAIYTVTTNYQTTVTPVAVIGSNSIVTATNYITNVFATYELHPKESVTTGIQTVGTVGTMLGFGPSGVIASIVVSLLGAWAAWKSNKRGKALTIFGQNIETASEIFLAQPGGPALNAKFKNEIISQQVEGGVKKMATEVHDNEVNPVAAKEAADRVMKPSNGP